MESNAVEFYEAIDPMIVRAVKDLCSNPKCEYPNATCLELLTGKRDFICPICGRDNSPPNYEEMYGCDEE